MDTLSEGGFAHDGTWVDFLEPGRVTRLVESLVKAKRLGKLTPAQAARDIAEAGLLKAFPMSVGWESHERWGTVPVSTSAEEAVKRSGLGQGTGHWCAGSWVSGPEKECRSAGHRQMPTAEEVKRLITTISNAFGG